MKSALPSPKVLTILRSWLYRPKWSNPLKTTHTRILLLYAVTMLAVMATAVPIFNFLVFSQVDERVREALREEMGDFLEAYEAWEERAPQTDAALTTFLDGFLADTIPEDDNFHIVIFGKELYAANPDPLPESIQPGSRIMRYWLTLRSRNESVSQAPNSRLGDILYKTHPLEVNGEYRGMFIIAHLTAGERDEALASVAAFFEVAAGVVLISFLLAWMGTRQLLKPVKQLAVTTRKISESDLSSRLEVRGSGELAELAANFNAMMNRLQNALVSQRNFLNDAGHELRTPLTIIQGHLELMGEDPEEREETVVLVMDEIDRMGRFVNDLILLAKSERPDFVQPETIDIQTFTEEIFSKITTLAERNWRLASVGQGKFVGDRQQITGALVNLALNATQHTKPEDTIELGTLLAESTVRFWVRDTGEGIAQEDQERIFERFARAANSYRRSDGVGLGLAIVKAVVEAHDGHIDLTSKLGEGSTFTLTFPVDPTKEDLS